MSERPHLHAVDPDGALIPPHNDEYERWVIGTAMARPDCIDDIRATGLTAASFYTIAHEITWAALLTLHVQGKPTDPITISDELERRKEHRPELRRASGGQTSAWLAALYGDARLPANAIYYADELVTLQTTRRNITAATRALAHPEDAPTIFREHLEQEQLMRGAGSTPHIGTNIDDFLAEDDDAYAWLIPGFLERGDRLILTAGEGHGKSTLLRQWCTQAAAGIHPFTLEPTDPVKVFLLDLENSKRQSRRKLRPLRLQAKNLDPANLLIECKVDGLNLSDPADRAWLDALIAHHQPDLLVTGPIYKLGSGDPTREEDAKPVAMAIDAIRARYDDLTIVLEAHSAKGNTGGNPKHRPKEPYGWSGWMRWPEFGIHLSEDGDLTHWRGMRDERQFPGHLERGGEWPWMPVMNLAEQRWLSIKTAIQNAPEKLSERQIADTTKISRSTVQRILAEHSAEVAALGFWRDLEHDS
ncbi:AAA family ATPase [Segeticoccus rhizosphaerae]|uniref:AAA family ATPase n=1 Tax=Segeticoccus rhizosphaerae TaxID=1104777 RepID=UPI001264911E|nr:AAA family ATPase [Segeticoccus rhizosphaerae]